MEKQVDKKHYDFSKYCKFGRWASYWYQLESIDRLKPQNILLIGVGDSVVSNYLKVNTRYTCTTLDIDTDLNPDIVGSVENMPLKDGIFIVIKKICVTLHMPYHHFFILNK